jgi:hypothetical protein
MSNIENNIPTDKLELLKYAIKNRINVYFLYKGKDYIDKRKMGMKVIPRTRYVSPAQIFRNKNTGNIILSAWQWGGGSNSITQKFNTGNTKGGKPHWKEFLIDEIQDVVLRQDGKGNYEHFTTPGDKTGTGANSNPITGNAPQPGLFRTDGGNNHATSVDVSVNTTEPINIMKPNKTEPTEPIEPTTKPKPDSIEKQIINNKPGLKTTQQKPTVVPIEPKQDEPKNIEPVNLVTPKEDPKPDIKTPEEEEDEWIPDQEPIQENKSFLKWILNLNYGPK